MGAGTEGSVRERSSRLVQGTHAASTKCNVIYSRVDVNECEKRQANVKKRRGDQQSKIRASASSGRVVSTNTVACLLTASSSSCLLHYIGPREVA